MTLRRRLSALIGGSFSNQGAPPRGLLRRKRFWGALAAMLLVGVLSVYVLRSLLHGEQVDFWQLLARIDTRMVLFSAGVYLIALALAVIGWSWIIGALSGVWRWRQHARIYCVTAITRRLPGTLWYIVGRVVMYERLGVPRALVAIGGGLEYAMILFSGLLVALAAWPLALDRAQLNPLWLLGGLLLGGLVLNPPVLRAAIRRISPQHMPALRYRDMLGWALVYAGVWVFGGGVLHVLATTIHPLPLTMLPIIVGIWATSGLVTSFTTFIPFGLGVQELTLTALLSPYVGGPAEALVIALLMRVVLTLNEVLWALAAGAYGLIITLRGGRDEQTVSLLTHEVVPHSDEQNPEEVYKFTPLAPPK